MNEPEPPVLATGEEAAEPRLGATPAPASYETVQSSPHVQKFRAAIAMLAGVAVGAIVIAIVTLATSSSGGPGQSWSDWSPPDGGLQGAQEIADHIAPNYRIDGTNQLAIVTASNLTDSASAANSTASSTSSSAAGPQLAVRANPSSSSVSLLGGNTIAFNLCGIGSSTCSIGVGTASADRMLLLRREALELALYTFRYIGGTQNVVAILPPGHSQPSDKLTPKPPSSQTATTGKPLDVALLFIRDELGPLINQPLSDTFQEQLPPTVSQLSLWKQTPEAALVAQLTERVLFSVKRSTTQDGTNLIVLNPLPPQ